jgi:hypothetical protein
MKLSIEIPFDLCEMVYLITDPDQKKRMVTTIHVRTDKSLQYLLSCSTTSSWHFPEEISKERNVLTVLTN